MWNKIGDLAQWIARKSAGSYVLYQGNPLGSLRGADSSALIKTYNNSPWVRMVTEKVAWLVGSLTWRLYRAPDIVGAKTITRLKSHDARQRALKLMRTQIDGEIEITDHVVLRALEEGNPVHSGDQVLGLVDTYLTLAGEGYIWWRRINVNTIELHPFPPTWIRRFPTADNETYEVNWAGFETKELPADHVLRFLIPNPEQPYGRGSGVVGTLADEIDSDELASKTVRSVFENRGVPSMIVHMEGASRDQAEQAEASFLSRFRNVYKAFQPWFVSTKIDVQKLAHTFEELRVLELRSFARDATVNVLGIPPEAVGILSNSNRATVTEARRLLAENVIVPRAERQRVVLQKWARQIDPNLILDYDSPSPTDVDVFLDVLRAAPYSVQVNEIRERVGLPSQGDKGDVSYVPLGASQVKTKTLDARRAKARVDDEIDKIADLMDEDELLRGTVIPWSNHVAENVISGMTENGFGEGSPVWQYVNPLAGEWIENYALTAIKNINDGTKEKTREILRQAVDNGWGVRRTVRELRDTVGSAQRAELIARTEVPDAMNGIRRDLLDRVGYTHKIWVTAGDERVRQSHADVSSDPVPMDHVWDVGGTDMEYPNDFNERCTIIGSTGDEKDAEALTTRKQIASASHIERKAKWIAEMIPTFQTAIEAQIESIEGELGDLLRGEE